MEAEVKNWLDEEMADFNRKVRAFNKKIYTQMYSVMAGHADGGAFARNLRIGSRGVLDYMHTVTDKFPMRFMVSPEYWVYCRDGQPVFVRVSEIKSVEYASEDRMKLHAGSANVSVNVNQGVTAFYVNYIDGVRGADGNPFDRFYFDTNEQLQEAVGLLRKHCPRIEKLWV